MGWPVPSSNVRSEEDSPFNLPAGDAPALPAVSTGHEAPTQQSGTAIASAVQTSTDATAQPTATGSLNAVPQRLHSEYLAEISIGGQQIQVDFDTGSSDFWVFNTLLPPAYRAGHQQFYDPNASATYRDLPGLHWEIIYGDYSAAKGVVGSDWVDMGGVRIDGQSVELATNLTYGFVRDVANDGLVGLGFSNINNVRPTRQRTVFDNLRPLLQRELFAASLKEDGTGSYDFGFVDPGALPAGSSERNLVQVGVDPSNGFWQVPSPAYGIAGIFHPRDQASAAIVDSGTSLLLVDPELAGDYWSRVQGAGISNQYGGYIYPCSTPLPGFGIAIGNVTKTGGPTGGWGGPNGTMIHVPPWMLAYAQVTDQYCYGALQSNQGYGLQVFGDILFRNAFVVFYGDIGNPHLGLIQKTATPPSPSL
ncbi:MAG: hypothetical protein Q9162_001129 [Coniocarpon cinnabarinum]